MRTLLQLAREPRACGCFIVDDQRPESLHDGILIVTRHRELLNEIAQTDHREFKQGLLKDEKLLDSLLGRLRGKAVQELRG